MTEHCEARQERLRAEMRAESIPALLVSNSVNVTWLTGFTGEASWLLVTADRLILFSDTRFEVQIAAECPGLETVIRGASQTTPELACSSISRMGLPGLAIEAASLSKAACDDLAERLPNLPLRPTTGLVESLRAIKDEHELELIRRSVAINERTFSVIRYQLRSGQTERDVGFSLEHQMRLLGADRCAFPPIVGVGEQAALPHARLTDRRIGSAPFVLIDWGTHAGGYASDLTRVVFTGPPPKVMLEIYETVRRAQAAAIALIRPGARLREIDAAARNLIADAGFGDRFGHGLGHGFGMEVHEEPFLRPSSTGVLKAGMVITIEPGIYLPGVGGVRLEDDILVTGDGHERLSRLPVEWESLAIDFL